MAGSNRLSKIPTGGLGFIESPKYQVAPESVQASPQSVLCSKGQQVTGAALQYGIGIDTVSPAFVGEGKGHPTVLKL